MNRSHSFGLLIVSFWLSVTVIKKKQSLSNGAFTPLSLESEWNWCFGLFAVWFGFLTADKNESHQKVEEKKKSTHRVGKTHESSSIRNTTTGKSEQVIITQAPRTLSTLEDNFNKDYCFKTFCVSHPPQSLQISRSSHICSVAHIYRNVVHNPNTKHVLVTSCILIQDQTSFSLPWTVLEFSWNRIENPHRTRVRSPRSNLHNNETLQRGRCTTVWFTWTKHWCERSGFIFKDIDIVYLNAKREATVDLCCVKLKTVFLPWHASLRSWRSLASRWFFTLMLHWESSQMCSSFE